VIDLKALQKQVALLEADLKPTGLASDRLKVEWRAARSADRTAATFETWIGERVTQVAVAWVLATVFVRFCEDNGLIEYPYIAGPGDRVQLAADLQQKYYENHPESDDRGWLEAAFAALSVSPVAAGLFDRKHNPMWTILPSPHAVKTLLDFWRQTGEDGQIRYNLTDPAWNTRFLGDLYQDLSESARKTYALLQTPEFVEEFILKYTLDPAIEEFGLEPATPVGHEDLPPGLRVIDPACGSGHFLLGAFRRLLSAWETASPTTDRYELVAKALSSVHGVDKNPFAAAIARFRLMLAAMRAAGIERLTEHVDFPLNIAVGDSLLHGKGTPGRQGELFGEETGAWKYRTEDVEEYIKSCRILEYGTYHVVIANPPYITVKDKAENDNIRGRYKKSCSGKYALSAPFAERMFDLAVLSTGYTGQITANSFMKREFGRKLIEELLPNIDLTHVIDTSGAYIPGHGTPTVILIGRRRFARSDSTIRAVLGIRGEPAQPKDPAQGYVWQAIVQQVDKPSTESEWVSVDDVSRDYFSRFPWSLSGGGADDLASSINRAPALLRKRLSRPIGFASFPGQDEAFFVGTRWLRRNAVSAPIARALITGETVRDWGFTDDSEVLVPFDADQRPIAFDIRTRWCRHLWTLRRVLLSTTGFGGQTREDTGESWWTWYRWVPERYATPLSVAFASVATHNHFVLDRGGKVFNRHAPVIKLPEAATEDDHLALLGILNSSTACFWLKQVSHSKGNEGYFSGFKAEAWERFYEFTGTKLEEFPLPAELPLEFGRELDALAQQLAVASTKNEDERIRGRMIALQEELDWDVYHRYGLITDEQATELMTRPGSVPSLKLGQRAFEIVMERGQLETQWFARHRSTPVPEIPKEWPEEYRRVVERRVEVIESDRNIGLIERPECKRRWQSEPWEVREARRLTMWLLDRCEDRSLWYDGAEPRPMTVNRLADRLRADAEVIAVARQLNGPDADLADVLKDVIADEHVPFLAAYRYKPSGLEKRTQWERTWDLQREEDATGKRLDIPVPPKYASADFQKQSYWRHRGKLDVPKERFLSYPGASPDSDKDSLLIGWAGWDHKDQATALIGLIEERSTTDGWDTERLTPLLAGLLEVMPWVRQWHHELDQAFSQSPAEAYDTYLTSERESRNLTEDALRAWRPPQAQRGRHPRS
jgi:N-6 DNA Methylase